MPTDGPSNVRLRRWVSEIEDALGLKLPPQKMDALKVCLINISAEEREEGRTDQRGRMRITPPPQPTWRSHYLRKATSAIAAAAIGDPLADVSRQIIEPRPFERTVLDPSVVNSRPIWRPGCSCGGVMYQVEDTCTYKCLLCGTTSAEAAAIPTGTLGEPLRKICPQCHPRFKDYLRADEDLCWRCGRRDLSEA